MLGFACLLLVKVLTTSPISAVSSVETLDMTEIHVHNGCHGLSSGKCTPTFRELR